MPCFIPEEETLDPEALGRLQRCKLQAVLDRALASNSFYQQKLGGVTFDPLHDSLDKLPLTTRDEIQRDQLAHPPYGSNLSFPLRSYSRLHQTSGSTGAPLRWLDTPQSWAWFLKCWRIIFAAACIEDGDRVFFPFSFGPFIGFWSAFDAASQMGCLCLPGGGLGTTGRLGLLLDNQASVVCCTPTYALRLAEVARQEGVDLAASSIRVLIVAGEPGGSIPATRQRIAKAWGAEVLDHAGMTEIGPWGFACPGESDGMYVIESEFVAEVIDPGTLQPVPDGQLGELVLTNLGRAGSPLIRYRTGDLVRLRRDRGAGGRWFARADGGILGRIDDMLFIRGNNVYPAAVEGIVRAFEEVAEFRMLVEESGQMAQMKLQVEFVPGADGAGLARRIGRAIRDRLAFRPEVVPVEPGSLPRFDMKAQRLVRDSEPRET